MPDQPILSATDERLIAMRFKAGANEHEHISVEQISDTLEDDSFLLWLDITAPQTDDLPRLVEEFGLHPLALEEMLVDHPRPKCMEFPGFYLLIIYAVDEEKNPNSPMRQIVIFISRRWLITTHLKPCPEVEECIQRWKSSHLLKDDTVAAPVYSLLDTVVDAYFPVCDAISDAVENLEDRLFAGETRDQDIQELFDLKKSMLSMRRFLSAERDALNLMLRQDVPVFSDGATIYLQSVYDHLVRLVESIDTYRDLLASAMDIHLSVISNRLNQVMKTLTVISALFMSASLISGIYGMNTGGITPGPNDPTAFWKVIGMIGGTSALLGILFWKLKWY